MSFDSYISNLVIYLNKISTLNVVIIELVQMKGHDLVYASHFLDIRLNYCIVLRSQASILHMQCKVMHCRVWLGSLLA